MYDSHSTTDNHEAFPNIYFVQMTDEINSLFPSKVKTENFPWRTYLPVKIEDVHWNEEGNSS